MGFGIGGSKSKSKSKTTSDTQQQTQQQVDVPDYLKPAVQNYASGLNNVFDLYGTPEKAQQLVAPVSGLQTSAYNLAGQLPALNDKYNQNYDLLNSMATGGPVNTTNAEASGYNAERYGPSSLLENLQSYMNPYTQSVVDTTNQQLNKQFGADAASLRGKQALSGGFGSSRIGLQQNDLTNQQAQTAAATNANLYNTGFNTATGLSNLDTDRRQGAAAANAQAANQAAAALAASQNAASLANAGAANQAALQNQQAQLAAAQAAAAGINSQGTYNNNVVGTQLAAGQDQRAVDEAQRNAYLAMLSKVGGLTGISGDDLLGQSGTTNTQQKGTGKTTGTSISASASYG